MAAGFTGTSMAPGAPAPLSFGISEWDSVHGFLKRTRNRSDLSDPAWSRVVVRAAHRPRVPCLIQRAHPGWQGRSGQRCPALEFKALSQLAADDHQRDNRRPVHARKTVCPVAQVPDGAHNTHRAWLKVWWHAVDEE